MWLIYKHNYNNFYFLLLFAFSIPLRKQLVPVRFNWLSFKYFFFELVTCVPYSTYIYIYKVLIIPPMYYVRSLYITFVKPMSSIGYGIK